MVAAPTTPARGDRMVEPGVQERVSSKGDVTYRAYLGKVDGKAKWSPAVSTLEEARVLRDGPAPAAETPAETPPKVTSRSPDREVTAAETVADLRAHGLFAVPARWRTIVADVLRSSGFVTAAETVVLLPLADARLGVLFVANTGTGMGWENWTPGPYQREAVKRIAGSPTGDAMLDALISGAVLDLAYQLPNRYDLGFHLSPAGMGGDPAAKWAGGTRA